MQDFGGGRFLPAEDCYAYLELFVNPIPSWTGFNLTLGVAVRSHAKNAAATPAGPQTFGQLQPRNISLAVSTGEDMKSEVHIDGAHITIPRLFDNFGPGNYPVWLYFKLPEGYAWNRPATPDGLPPITALNGDPHPEGSDFELYGRWEPEQGHDDAQQTAYNHRHLYVKYRNTWNVPSEFALNTTPAIRGEGLPGGGTITNSPGGKN